MRKISIKAVLIPALSLFVICLVVTALLAGTDALTKDTIEAQNKQKAETSRRVVLPDADNFESDKLGEITYYIGRDAAGEKVGFVFSTKSKGYGGDIEVMTGISADGEVTGVTLLSQSETPGLGANAAKESFTGQYKQKAPQNGFGVTKTAPANDGEIVAMTGATISSAAVTDAVNQAVAAYYELGGKGGDS